MGSPSSGSPTFSPAAFPLETEALRSRVDPRIRNDRSSLLSGELIGAAFLSTHAGHFSAYLG